MPTSLAGLPSLSLPVGIDDTTSLPIGMQIIGKAFDEQTILNVGKALQNATGYTLPNVTDMK